jgi:hypothetical protein
VIVSEDEIKESHEEMELGRRCLRNSNLQHCDAAARKARSSMEGSVRGSHWTCLVKTLSARSP